MKADLLAALVAARAAKHAVMLVTRISDGAQTLVNGTSVRGDLSLNDKAVAEIRARLVGSRSGFLDSDTGLFARSYVPAPRLLIVGAVHIGQALLAIASVVGFDVIIIDPRAAFAAPQRFEGVRISRDWPDEAIKQLEPDASTAVVTLTHDPKLDDPALVAALRSPAFYVGALGSRRTHAKRLARLQELGVEGDLHRLHAPVGLDLGGRSASEIALSIMAEIIQVRCKGQPG
jgi:xanthine dehydrogenase accessory factor